MIGILSCRFFGRHVEQRVDVRGLQADSDLSSYRLAWADVVRVLAAAAIFIYHFSVQYLRIWGSEPSTWSRFVHDHFAAWAIAMFVVLSGFSLALACFRSVPWDFPRYARKRLTRLFAPYWTIAVPFAIVGFALGEASLSSIWKLPIWLLGLGPISPSTYSPISEAWWYVSLAVQVALLMPLLIKLHRVLGPLGVTFVALVANTATLWIIQRADPRWWYLAHGLVFARLAEVVTGLIAASILLKRRSRQVNLAPELASVALVVAFAALLPRYWFVPTNALIVLAAVFTACSLAISLNARPHRWLAALAAYTYCFYLVQAPVVKYAQRALYDRGFEGVIAVLPLVLAATLIVTWLADWVARRYTVPIVDSVLRSMTRPKLVREKRADVRI